MTQTLDLAPGRRCAQDKTGERGRAAGNPAPIDGAVSPPQSHCCVRRNPPGKTGKLRDRAATAIHAGLARKYQPARWAARRSPDSRRPGRRQRNRRSPAACPRSPSSPRSRGRSPPESGSRRPSGTDATPARPTRGRIVWKSWLNGASSAAAGTARRNARHRHRTGYRR